jgi:hypothetical protein
MQAALGDLEAAVMSTSSLMHGVSPIHSKLPAAATGTPPGAFIKNVLMTKSEQDKSLLSVTSSCAGSSETAAQTGM